MDVSATPNAKWDDQLDIVVSPGADDCEIEVAVELRPLTSECDLRKAMNTLAGAVATHGDDFEAARFEGDPTTGAPGPVNRLLVVTMVERLVERLLPADVELGDVA